MVDREAQRQPEDLSLSLRPPRRAFVLAYLGVVLSGLLGAAIGAGLVDSMCQGGCGTNVAVGGLAGAIVATGGVSIVAILVLRAMHEWNEYQARTAADVEPPQPKAGPGGPQPKDSRRNPSA